MTGLFPSNPGVHETLTVLVEGILYALTAPGAYGSSMTFSLAERVSLPPGEETRQVYSPTSAALTSPISRVPSGSNRIREPGLGLMELKQKKMTHLLCRTIDTNKILMLYFQF